LTREKIQRVPEYREVVYDDEHWRLLRELRSEALRIVEFLVKNGYSCFIHGSIARGDVWKGSDIDVVIPYPIPSYRLEYLLEANGFNIYARYIVVATPSSTAKAYITLDPGEKKTISFPLSRLKPREYEFYRFGGLLDYDGLKRDERVPGVDKRLVFIDPKPYGHDEYPVIGYEGYVASRLGISVETVLERERVLSRRDEIGRTGVFIKYVLKPDEVFEEVLDRILKEYAFLKDSL